MSKPSHRMSTRSRRSSSGSKTPTKALSTSQLRHITKYKPLEFMNESQHVSEYSSSPEDIEPEDCEACDTEGSKENSHRLMVRTNGKKGQKRTSSGVSRTPLAENSCLGDGYDTTKVGTKGHDHNQHPYLNVTSGDNNKESLDSTAVRPISNKKDKRPTRQLFSGERIKEKDQPEVRPRSKAIKGRRARISFGGPDTPGCSNGTTPSEEAAPPHVTPHNGADDITIPFQLNNSVHTPTNYSTPAKSTREDTGGNNDSLATGGASPVCRRVTRLWLRTWLTQGSPVREREFGPVLAYDTPEEDYGLSVVERNKKYGRSRSVKSKLCLK